MTTRISALATDLYEVTMMAGYYACGATGPATFDLFARHLPPHRAYLIAAGLDQALAYLEGLRFEPEEIDYLRSLPEMRNVAAEVFDRHLPQFRFTGEVWAVPEGETVFPGEPILRVTAPLPEAQFVETALLALVMFQTSVASKAARVVEAAAGRTVVEFGSRRAHGTRAALHAARAAFVGGCDATSNVEAGWRFGIPPSGTMAHSWVMTFADEIDAFREFSKIFGGYATLLIDTYDTVAAAHKIIESGLRPPAVRLDSGDLVALSRDVRAILNAGGLQDTKIFVSGDLDEYRIAALLHGGGPIDGFGVGAALSTSVDAPSLGGVYKLAELERNSSRIPVAKLSPGKETFPGRKQVWRTLREGRAGGDAIALEEETPPAGARPLLECVMRNGRRTAVGEPDLPRAQERCRQAVAALPDDLRRLDATHEPYHVSLTPAVLELAERARRAATGG